MISSSSDGGSFVPLLVEDALVTLLYFLYQCSVAHPKFVAHHITRIRPYASVPYTNGGTSHTLAPFGSE